MQVPIRPGWDLFLPKHSHLFYTQLFENVLKDLEIINVLVLQFGTPFHPLFWNRSYNNITKSYTFDLIGA